MTALFGQQFALNWPGSDAPMSRVYHDGKPLWQGQPAWVSQRRGHGVTAVTLALPWLNVLVMAEAPDAQQAHALLDNVQPYITGWHVPATATSVFVQTLAGRDSGATVKDSADVRALLDELRALIPVTDPARACDGSWWRSTALLTVHEANGTSTTYAARFGSCSLVTAGTGVAAATSQQLLNDIRRLAPNSGL